MVINMKKTTNFQQLVTSVNGGSVSGLVGHSIVIGDDNVQVVISGATPDQLRQFCAAYYIGNGDEFQIDFDKTQETVIFDRSACGGRAIDREVTQFADNEKVNHVAWVDDKPMIITCAGCGHQRASHWAKCPRCEATKRNEAALPDVSSGSPMPDVKPPVVPTPPPTRVVIDECAVFHRWEIQGVRGNNTYSQCKDCGKRRVVSPTGFGYPPIDKDWLNYSKRDLTPEHVPGMVTCPRCKNILSDLCIECPTCEADE